MWEDIKGVIKGFLRFIARGVLVSIALSAAYVTDIGIAMGFDTPTHFYPFMGWGYGIWIGVEVVAWCYRILRSS